MFKIHRWLLPSAATALLLAACGGGSSGNNITTPPPPPPPPPPPGLATGAATCAGGMAADFICSGISLRSRVPLSDMGGVSGSRGNDIWGWIDPQNGDEYALMGLTNGTAFVDVTDPENPTYLGRLPTNTVSSTWRDMKVFQDHAYVVADGAGAHGMQVFDLTRLRGVTSPQTFAPDVVYSDIANAHNLAINEDTGFAYAVGTNTCNEGLHIINISTPDSPAFEACHIGGDTHDTQCVIYQGPDVLHAGQEICFSSNGDHFAIENVQVKTNTFTMSTATYPQLGFVHQGWLTEDHRFFLLGDELDEQNFLAPTRTIIFDVSDLDAPVYVSTYEATTASIDHNMYVVGNRIYQANYTSGLRVLEFQDLGNSEISEIAFFDTYPAGDDVAFEGLWSVYPYFPSGNIIASDRSNGLFVMTIQ